MCKAFGCLYVDVDTPLVTTTRHKAAGAEFYSGINVRLMVRECLLFLKNLRRPTGRYMFQWQVVKWDGLL